MATHMSLHGCVHMHPPAPMMHLHAHLHTALPINLCSNDSICMQSHI